MSEHVICFVFHVATLNAPLTARTLGSIFKDRFPRLVRMTLTLGIYHEEFPHKYMKAGGGVGANNVIIHLILLRWQSVSALFARV